MDELLLIQENLRYSLSECGRFLEEIFENGVEVLKDEDDAEQFMTNLKKFKSTYEKLEDTDEKIIKKMEELLKCREEIEEMDKDIDIFRKRWKKLYNEVESILTKGDFEKSSETSEVLSDVLSTVLKAGAIAGVVLGGVAVGVKAAGFKSAGVQKNSIASNFQRTNYGGHTPGDSWFSTFQRMGTKGPSTGTTLAVGAVGLLAAAAHTFLSKKNTKN